MIAAYVGVIFASMSDGSMLKSSLAHVDEDGPRAGEEDSVRGGGEGEGAS